MGVSAMAFGGIPITRAELWVDGELVDTEETRIEGGVSPFYASFEFLVPQGLHSVFVRAVNAVGLIGDSWPVGIGGVERPGPDDPARLVTVAEGQTLEEIATDYDVNPETVQQLNPDLGGQQPPAGSTVVQDRSGRCRGGREGARARPRPGLSPRRHPGAARSPASGPEP